MVEPIFAASGEVRGGAGGEPERDPLVRHDAIDNTHTNDADVEARQRRRTGEADEQAGGVPQEPSAT